MYDESGAEIGHKQLPIAVGKDQSLSLQDALTDSFCKKPENREFCEFIVKSILYIESGEPDLQREEAKKHFRKFQKTKRLNKLCPFDVVNVGYSFHNRVYSVDQGPRRGHFRWQPYGPKKSMLKLIWIDETTVHYNKKKCIDPSNKVQSP